MIVNGRDMDAPSAQTDLYGRRLTQWQYLLARSWARDRDVGRDQE